MTPWRIAVGALVLWGLYLLLTWSSPVDPDEAGEPDCPDEYDPFREQFS